MDERIASENGIPDSFLNNFSLNPGLSLYAVDIAVCSEEWVEHSKLVKLNE